MAASYQTGAGDQDVSLAVDIATSGLAATRAATVIPGSGNPLKEVAKSKDGTGDIAETPIGKASALEGQTLAIMTKIDLSAIPKLKDRKVECERITAKYVLKGGSEGKKDFLEPDAKTPSDDYKVVALDIEIKLNA